MNTNGSTESKERLGDDTVIFDLSQVPAEERCQFVLHCPRENLKDVSFALDGEDIEMPLKEVGAGEELWLLNVRKMERQMGLRVQIRK